MLQLPRFRMKSLYKTGQIALVVLLAFLILLHLTSIGTRSFRGHINAGFSTSLGNMKDGNVTLMQAAPDYVKAIMTPEDTTFPRLECPNFNQSRYEHLRSAPRSIMDTTKRRKYFFALMLHENVNLLPRLLGSIIETIRFLGSTQCAFSIVEGRSTDGTFEVVRTLGGGLEKEGIEYFLKSSDQDPMASANNRIEVLADLRNQALEPMINNSDQYNNKTTVIFLNDVSICMEDILELIYQREHQNADMTCGMDWENLWRDPTFFDVWIARGMNGDSFFEIPPDGSWNNAWNLFWNNQKAQERFNSHLPFQVFSCWNGATAFTAKPFLQKQIKFRSVFEGECFQGEPMILCKELWHLGYGKIAIVPSVNVEYSDDGARNVKNVRGNVSMYLDESWKDEIEWESTPPSMVKCWNDYSNQEWKPWDEFLDSEKT